MVYCMTDYNCKHCGITFENPESAKCPICGGKLLKMSYFGEVRHTGSFGGMA